MKFKQIELHPGHWKLENSGAVGLVKEVVEARKVTNRVYELLKNSGVNVVKYEDNVSNNKRDNVNYLVKKHNEDNDALIVSIHFNASGATVSQGIGTETLYFNQYDLAKEVTDAIAKASGLKNRGAKQRKDIGVLIRTVEKAILIEVCFVNSKEDVRLYKENFEEICMAIAKVLAKATGKTLSVKPEEEKPVEGNDFVLTKNAREACRAIIKRAVAEKVFKDAHKDVDKYDDNKLVSYALIYINRKLGK